MAQLKGDNKLGARSLMIERSAYNVFALAKLNNVSGPTLETLQIKDFLKDEKLLIGRLDENFNPVFPEYSYLKSLSSNVSAMNFVADAFSDMKAKFNRALRTGQISLDTAHLSELKAFKAYANPKKLYNSYVASQMEQFNKFVKRRGRINKIKDYDTFFPFFMSFIEMNGTSLPFTKSMFYMSRFTSPLSSGLIIEIADLSYSEDQPKIEHFYEQRNFEYLKNLAYAHGFVIDKHIPWRLVADLNSPQMAPYLRRYIPGPNPDAASTMRFAFGQTYRDEIPSLAKMSVDFYNYMVSKNPKTSVASPRATISRNCHITKKTTQRRRVNLNFAINRYPNSHWLDMYAKIRNIETGIGYDKETLEIIANRANDLANSLDNNAGLGYIVSKFDNVEHFEGSLFHDIVRLDLSRQPGATEDDVSSIVDSSVQISNFVVY